jgi:hypothetical protein
MLQFAPFRFQFNVGHLMLTLRIFSFANFLILPAWQITLDTASVSPSWWQLYEMIFGLLFFSLIIFLNIKLIKISRKQKYYLIPAFILFAVLTFFFFGTLSYLKQSILNGASLIEPLTAFGIHPIVGKLLLVGVFASLLFIFRKKLFIIFAQLLDIASPLFLILTISFLWTFHSSIWTPSEKVQGAHGRQVVWLVFDELDSQFLRNASQELPNFNFLNNRGIVFTNAYPPSNATAFSLASYWLGDIPKSTRIRPSGVEIKVGNEWLVDWDKKSTIFIRRIDAGDSVFIRGWYLPYCKTFSGSAKVPCKDHSNFYGPSDNIGILRWLILDNYLTKIFQEALTPDTVLSRYTQYFVSKIKGLFWFYQSEILKEGAIDVDRHIKNHDNLVFWHVNCPHLPAFSGPMLDLDRSQAEIDVEDYKNNLHQCDKVLGDILHTLNEIGNNFMLVVVSDHWFRQRKLANVAIPQTIPFFIILGGEHEKLFKPIKINSEINTVFIPRLVDAYLNGGVESLLSTLKGIDSSWAIPTKIIYDSSFKVHEE